VLHPYFGQNLLNLANGALRRWSRFHMAVPLASPFPTIPAHIPAEGRVVGSFRHKGRESRLFMQPMRRARTVKLSRAPKAYRAFNPLVTSSNLVRPTNEIAEVIMRLSLAGCGLGISGADFAKPHP
jgi:hypothetical protein